MLLSFWNCVRAYSHQEKAGAKAKEIKEHANVTKGLFRQSESGSESEKDQRGNKKD